MSRGPDRVVGGFARNIMGVLAPLPDDLEFEVCSYDHRQLTPEVEKALRAAEDAHLNSLKRKQP